jgi:glycosyltransferase involved in cell wall biosynthesis
MYNSQEVVYKGTLLLVTQIVVSSEIILREFNDTHFLFVGKFPNVPQGVISTYVARARKNNDSVVSEGTLFPRAQVLELSLSRLQTGALLPIFVFKRAFKLVRRCDAVLVTLPGLVGSSIWLLAKFLRKPIILNVVGDPESALSRGNVSSSLRGIAHYVLPNLQRLACKNAKLIRYVTNNSLQRVYPPGPMAKVFAYSDVLIDSVSDVQLRNFDAKRISVFTVASLDQPYKGISELMHAIKLLNDKGMSLVLTIVGDGKLRPEYEELASHLLPGACFFTGTLKDSNSVKQRLKEEADLFVLASYTEGLPRAMIEAMSIGIPCIGTNVGGMTELLNEIYIAQPRDYESLAGKIELLCNSNEFALESSRSLLVASRYDQKVLSIQEREFMKAIEELVS